LATFRVGDIHPEPCGANASVHVPNSTRWYDNRHTLITELAESAASGDVIMSIATGNGSPALDMVCCRSSVTRPPLRKHS